MSVQKLALALKVLRETELEKCGARGGLVAGLSQAAKGAVGLGKTVGKATLEGAKRSGEVLSRAGHPILGTAATYTPHVLAAGAAMQGYKGLKQKYELHKYRQALKAAQRQQGY